MLLRLALAGSKECRNPRPIPPKSSKDRFKPSLYLSFEDFGWLGRGFRHAFSVWNGEVLGDCWGLGLSFGNSQLAPVLCEHLGLLTPS